ncbi:hypothetical protein [Psychrobacter sp. I-STPA6b]|uniref:hypothetical protein n=1 Tax=Psychrobacter sp. I-STPA6b TaxID=2585718 RepID=UPI001D0CBE58|nr:hypothetical protein [Psychrobacter sp. I-STPA6b]
MVNKRINTYAYQLGFVPILDKWLLTLNNLINQTKIDNTEDKAEFLENLDALIILYSNGTYYEVDQDNIKKINKIKTKLKNFLDKYQWTEDEHDLLYRVYLHSF